jgi:hypothetical protein
MVILKVCITLVQLSNPKCTRIMMIIDPSNFRVCVLEAETMRQTQYISIKKENYTSLAIVPADFEGSKFQKAPFRAL